MRAKSAKRLEAERLRTEQGLSYREIEGILGVNRSTLSYWLRDIALTPEQEARLQERIRVNRAEFAARAWPINRERYRRAREDAYQAGADVVARLPEDPSVDELALAMLYLGEGAKSANRAEMASTTPEILRYFVWALTTLIGIGKTRLSCHIHLVEAAAHLEDALIDWWAQQIGMPQASFRRTTYDRRPRNIQLTDDYRGVCVVSCFDTYLQQRILGLAHTYVQSRITGSTRTNKRPATLSPDA